MSGSSSDIVGDASDDDDDGIHQRRCGKRGPTAVSGSDDILVFILGCVGDVGAAVRLVEFEQDGCFCYDQCFG